MFDAQILLNPFEEQLDLPTLLVKRGDRFRRQRKIVCEKHKPLAGFGIDVPNPPQVLRIIQPRVKSNRLIGHDAGRFIGRVRIDSMILHVDLGAGDEERTSLRKTIQPPKIDIASIHDIDGSDLRARSSPEPAHRPFYRWKHG